LAQFVSAFGTLGVSDGLKGAGFGFEVRYGRSIDQDDKPTHWDEPVLEGPSGGGIYVASAISYDAEDTDLTSLHELAAALTDLGARTIYRANLSLGHVVRPLFEALRQEPSKENEVGLGLDTWSMELGPVMSCNLATERPYHVGWIAVSLSGFGYLHPRSFRDLIERAEALEPIRALLGLCRTTWPVAPRRPSRRVVKACKAMAELWPYARPDQPSDWFWGIRDGA
jgi:hypothetical protein